MKYTWIMMIILLSTLASTVTAQCEPRWHCSAWSECTDGLQERACLDMNMCGDESERPIEQAPCLEGLPPNVELTGITIDHKNKEIIYEVGLVNSTNSSAREETNTTNPALQAWTRVSARIAPIKDGAIISLAKARDAFGLARDNAAGALSSIKARLSFITSYQGPLVSMLSAFFIILGYALLRKRNELKRILARQQELDRAQ